MIPLFTSIFLLNRTEPDEIMVLLPTQGLTGSVWGDNWVRRQQLCSWINCCTELLNYCGSVCKPYNVCTVLTSWSPSSSNVHALLRAFLGQMIYRPSLQFTTVTSQLIIPFSQRSADFFCACHSSLHDPFTRLLFTTICGFWSNLGLGLWVFRPLIAHRSFQWIWSFQ